MAHSFLSLGPRQAGIPVSGLYTSGVPFLFPSARPGQNSVASIITIVAANPTAQIIERPGDQPST